MSSDWATKTDLSNSRKITPFQLYAGYSKDAFDYIVLFIFLFAILRTAAATPTFSDENQTGSDSILRCTKHGRSRLATVKIMAALLAIGGLIYLLATISFTLYLSAKCMEKTQELLGE